MANAAVITTEPGDVECPVCHEEFSVPKILPCAHILCRDCLVTWLTSDTEAHCPLCRRIIANVNERIHRKPEAIADALPTDLSMVAVVKSSSRLRESQVCCVCPNVAAVALCLSCDDMLCRTCANGHGKLRATRHHKVEDLSSLTARGLAARGTNMCTVHADEACKLYCTSHNVSICQVCATTKHRTCPEVIELETKAKAASAKLDELLDKLKQGQADLDQAVLDLDKQGLQIGKTQEESMREIDKMYKCLKMALKARCDELRECIQKSSSCARTCVDIYKATAGAQRGTLTAHQLLVERVKESIPYSDLDDMTSMLQARVKDLNYTVPKQALSLKTFKISSHELPQMKDSLNKVGHLADTNLPQTAPALQAQQTPQLANSTKSSGGSLSKPGVSITSDVQINPKQFASTAFDLSQTHPFGQPSTPSRGQPSTGARSQTPTTALGQPSFHAYGPQHQQYFASSGQPSTGAHGQTPTTPLGQASFNAYGPPHQYFASTGQLSSTQYGLQNSSSYGPLFFPQHGLQSQPSTPFGHSSAPSHSQSSTASHDQPFPASGTFGMPFEIGRASSRSYLSGNDPKTSIAICPEGVKNAKDRKTVDGMVKLKYDREFLLSLQESPASRSYPQNLPDLPDIILGQEVTGKMLMRGRGRGGAHQWASQIVPRRR